MPDEVKEDCYTFQMVPKSRGHLKVSVPQMTPTRSITTGTKLCCATCIRRTIQGAGFVQPREENMHGESNHSFLMPREWLQKKWEHSFHKDAQRPNNRQQAQVVSGIFCLDTRKKCFTGRKKKNAGTDWLEKQWNLSLKVFMIWLNKALDNLIQGPASTTEGWTRVSPTQTSL